MLFYNINNPSSKVTLKEAVLKSTSSVSDLYMPENIPVLPSAFLDNLKGMTFSDIAAEVSRLFLSEDLPGSVIEQIVSGAFTFDAPLKELEKGLYVLELFHGPTLAFKDFGARYMAALFEYFVRNENREINILVATSGDTGSAVASAFLNRKGIRVVILFPSGGVSAIQEKQLTTMGGNIISLKVDGTFDDCQSLVKQAFADKELNDYMNLSSANSINFARLLPQSFYYFYALSQMALSDLPVVISVPSGNFGNLTAGLIARKMGLSVERFIASTNVNHSVPEYLSTGIFEPRKTIQTVTNAMDVGNPSNFPRILELLGRSHKQVSSVLEGYWFTDEETFGALGELYSKYSYQADPHGAVGYLGLRKYRETNSCAGIFLETAHPVKFPDIVEKATGKNVDIPYILKGLLTLEERSIKIEASYDWFKSFLLSM